jgi:hypothetical protein
LLIGGRWLSKRNLAVSLWAGSVCFMPMLISPHHKNDARNFFFNTFVSECREASAIAIITTMVLDLGTPIELSHGCQRMH